MVRVNCRLYATRMLDDMWSRLCQSWHSRRGTAGIIFFRGDIKRARYCWIIKRRWARKIVLGVVRTKYRWHSVKTWSQDRLSSTTVGSSRASHRVQARIVTFGRVPSLDSYLRYIIIEADSGECKLRNLLRRTEQCLYWWNEKITREFEHLILRWLSSNLHLLASVGSGIHMRLPCVDIVAWWADTWQWVQCWQR